MADETALRIDAVITDSHGNSLHAQAEESADFDIDEWHQLLAQNRGDSLSIVVSAKYEDGWHTYRPFPIYVSPDSIDYGLCYRLIEPGYEVWSKMGIYERDLSSFEERPLIENTQFAESFHNWSTNSRWLVLSSRRDDGLFTRPYFCHVDQEGNVTKAFMLPQRNPRHFYRARFMSFNVPDFITAPTRFDSRQASKAINDAYRKNFGVR